MKTYNTFFLRFHSFVHSLIYSTNIYFYQAEGIVLGYKDKVMDKTQHGFCLYKAFHLVMETDYQEVNKPTDQEYGLSH